MHYLKHLKAHKGKILLGIAIVAVSIYFLMNRVDDQFVDMDFYSIRPAENVEDRYFHVSNQWTAGTPTGVNISVPATELSNDASFSSTYDGDTFIFRRGDTVTFDVGVNQSGAYHFALDQMDIGRNILANKIAVKVNGVYLYEESQNINLPTRWVFAQEGFTLDRYGNEILSSSVKLEAFEKSYFYDSTALNAKALTFLLYAGINEIEITNLSGDLELGNFYVESVKTYPTYEEYLNMHEGPLQSETLITIGAEELFSKTNPSTRLMSERDPSATSYDTRYLRLNALDGYSFRNGNDQITYQVEVEEAGYYYLGFKYRQNYLMQMPVFREVRINGEVPFEEVALMPFNHTSTYQNTLLNHGDEPFMFYFDEGLNDISLRVVVEPYHHAYENIVVIMDEITDLSLEIKRLTGNTSDRYRRWRIEEYIPDIESRFERWLETLYHVHDELEKYSLHDNPGELTNLNLTIGLLEELYDDINDIPNKMVMLADGDSSASQFLGTSIQNYLQNGLDIERIYVTGTEDLPNARANVFRRTFESARRFVLSFFRDDYGIGNAEEGVLEIWVNHPRQYIEIMQQIIDTEFTPQTGIEIKLSLMPDENKLILANAAGTAPDIALGVNHWLPYEFAIRNASLDLRQFDGYTETVSQFAPGAMVPYAFEEGVYGMPQTQNFWVTYYREDTLGALDLPVPETWEEVIGILPELQRFGMNYYQPLAMHGGFKPFVSTIPFIYQFGGELYAEDGMSTLINSEESLEGMRLMTDLFTIYNMPKEVPNFYNHFRFGTMPIGISDLSTYLQLTIAAPEIAGKWNIAPHPGVLQENGEIVRFAASGAQSNMIISTTEYPEESWQFLEWWMSTEVQTNYATRLQTTYGTEYLWNTANLEAFQQLPLPQEHIDVIMAQWEYALEASRVPGAYMVEREISNAWNKIVFDDANPRITLDEAVKISNREILYRMEEFGYVENNRVLKPYKVPTIANIHEWLRGHNDD